MPLTNFEFGEEEIDGTIIVKAYDGNRLVLAFIAREDIDDYLDRPYTPQSRRIWVEQNLGAIGSVMSAKYDRDETKLYKRFGSTMPSVGISAADLRGMHA